MRSRLPLRRFAVAVVFCASLGSSAIVPRGVRADVSPAPWTKIEDADGITVYRREVPGSDVIAFRGEATVSAPLARVVSVIADTARAPEWVDSLVEARILRRLSDTEYVEYDHYATPIVLKDRDFVTLSRFDYDPQSRTVTLRLRSTTDAAAPKTSYVRGEILSSTFALTPTPDGKATRVTGEVHCDPKGSVPKWIVNYFQKDWPRKTFTKLRAQVAKPHVVEHPMFRKLVDAAPRPLQSAAP